MKKILLLTFILSLAGCSYFKPSKNIELIPFLQKDKFGYFNLEGKIIINPQFSVATAFREGLALVKTSGEKGKWGFIDKNGKFVINAIYKEATVFQEDLAWVISENSAPVAINKKGEIEFTLKEAEKVRLFSEDLAAFSVADSTTVKWGFVDKSGKQVINPQFTEVRHFSDGKCAVKNKEGKWGYIDKSGKIAINHQFDNASDFIEGKATVGLDDKIGVIDENGKYTINPQFQAVFFDNDKFLIFQDDKAGWCDKDGKFLINPQFDGAEIFGNEKIACVKSGDKYGYIDSSGKITINPQFDSATQFIGNIAIVEVADKFGLIDHEGKYLVNPQFEGIGIDVYAYIYDYSIYNSVSSDYLDISKILNIININNPENLSFDDDFQTIVNKTNKSPNDFSAYSETNIIFEDKFITNEASYTFGVMGKAKSYDYYSYSYYITKEKPQGFIYAINLLGKASGKAENIQKGFEKTLKNYTLLKKGYVDNQYTSVFKSDKNIIITSNQNSNKVIVYILNKSFDTSYYINKIKEKPTEESLTDGNNYRESKYYDSYADTTYAPVADTVEVSDSPYYD